MVEPVQNVPHQRQRSPVLRGIRNFGIGALGIGLLGLGLGKKPDTTMYDTLPVAGNIQAGSATDYFGQIHGYERNQGVIRELLRTGEIAAKDDNVWVMSGDLYHKVNGTPLQDGPHKAVEGQIAADNTPFIDPDALPVSHKWPAGKYTEKLPDKDGGNINMNRIDPGQHIDLSSITDERLNTLELNQYAAEIGFKSTVHDEQKLAGEQADAGYRWQSFRENLREDSSYLAGLAALGAGLAVGAGVLAYRRNRFDGMDDDQPPEQPGPQPPGEEQGRPEGRMQRVLRRLPWAARRRAAAQAENLTSKLGDYQLRPETSAQTYRAPMENIGAEYLSTMPLGSSEYLRDKRMVRAGRIEQLYRMLNSDGMSAQEAAEALGVSRSTVYRDKRILSDLTGEQLSFARYSPKAATLDTYVREPRNGLRLVRKAA